MEKGNITRISADMEFSGEINYHDILVVEGSVKGIIKSDGKVIITERGRVQGDIYAKNLEIQGEVQGNIYEAGFVQLAPTCVLHGDIFSKELQIERGARYYGSSTMITE